MNSVRYGVLLALLLIAPAADDADLPHVVINEIHYNPGPGSEGVGEFAELFNRGESRVGLSGWRLRGAVKFTFPPKSALEPGGFLVVVGSEKKAKGGGVPGVAGQYDGQLNNGGARIVLVDGDGRKIDTVRYADTSPWPAEADGAGPSLELRDPESDNANPSNWGLGQPFTPGQPNAPTSSEVGAVVITEIMYKPRRHDKRERFNWINEGIYMEEGDDPSSEYVELFNRGEAAIDLDGWKLTDGITFTFPAGTKLAPGGYVVACRDPNRLAQRIPEATFKGPFSGSLGDGGERITLRDASGRIVDTVRYSDHAPWPSAPDESGVSLEVIDPNADNGTPANWRSSREKLRPPNSSRPKKPNDTKSKKTQPMGKDGWLFVTNTGRATSGRLYIYLDGPGDWLIDDLSMTPVGKGENLIPNGSFNSGVQGWEKTGTHETTRWRKKGGRNRSPCVHIEATGAGESSGDSFHIPNVPGVVRSKKYTIGFWAKHIAGSGVLTLRLSDGGLRTTVSAFEGSSDWSDLRNPSGPWSYRDGEGKLLEKRSRNWHPGVLGKDQSSWTSGRRGKSGWCQSEGASRSFDFPEGWIAGHSPCELRWIAPNGGGVAIHGDMFLPRKSKARLKWEIRLDDEVLSEGDLSAKKRAHDSRRPKSFASGSGRKEALVQPVVAGSQIKLVITSSDDGSDGLVALDLAVALAPPPPELAEKLFLSSHVGNGTPGRKNSVLGEGLPPLVTELSHSPKRPTSEDRVTVTAAVSSETPVKSVRLLVSTDDAGSFESLRMFDDGVHGDRKEEDGQYGVFLSSKRSETLVHYKVRAENDQGAVAFFPQPDEPSPTQAYFSFDDEIETKLTMFHLFMDDQDLHFLDHNRRSPIFKKCTMVIDGVVYPNMGACYRGQASRGSPKRQWKFRFNKSQLYKKNRVLDTWMAVPMMQRIAMQIFKKSGATCLGSDLVRIHLNGEFWGVYMVLESPNSAWLAKRGYNANGEVYKARSVNTEDNSSNSDLFLNRDLTDFDYWGIWNKKIRSLEKPTHIRDLTENLNNLDDEELLPWLAANVDLNQWFTQWAVYVLMGIDDFPAHNYYLFLPGENGGRWQWLPYDFDSLGRSEPIRVLYGDGKEGDDPSWRRNKFFERVSDHRTLRHLYFLKMREVMKRLCRLRDMHKIVDREYKRSLPDMELDWSKWGSRGYGGRWGHLSQGTEGLKAHFERQRDRAMDFIENQDLPDRDDAPDVKPTGKLFRRPIEANISVSRGWKAVYTLDGTDPRLSETRRQYKEPIRIDRSTTLKTAAVFRSIRSGEWTDVITRDFKIDDSGGGEAKPKKKKPTSKKKRKTKKKSKGRDEDPAST